MKALLCEYGDKRKNTHSVIVLLPSGKIEAGIGDLINVALELEGEKIRVWIIRAAEIASFKTIKEVEVGGRFLLEVLEYRNARVEYELQSVQLKDRLMHLMLTKNSDAFTFLDVGSVVL